MPRSIGVVADHARTYVPWRQVCHIDRGGGGLRWLYPAAFIRPASRQSSLAKECEEGDVRRREQSREQEDDRNAAHQGTCIGGLRELGAQTPRTDENVPAVPAEEPAETDTRADEPERNRTATPGGETAETAPRYEVDEVEGSEADQKSRPGECRKRCGVEPQGDVSRG